VSISVNLLLAAENLGTSSPTSISTSFLYLKKIFTTSRRSSNNCKRVSLARKPSFWASGSSRHSKRETMQSAAGLVADRLRRINLSLLLPEWRRNCQFLHQLTLSNTFKGIIAHQKAILMLSHTLIEVKLSKFFNFLIQAEDKFTLQS